MLGTTTGRSGGRDTSKKWDVDELGRERRSTRAFIVENSLLPGDRQHGVLILIVVADGEHLGNVRRVSVGRTRPGRNRLLWSRTTDGHSLFTWLGLATRHRHRPRRRRCSGGVRERLTTTRKLARGARDELRLASRGLNGLQDRRRRNAANILLRVTFRRRIAKEGVELVVAVQRRRRRAAVGQSRRLRRRALMVRLTAASPVARVRSVPFDRGKITTKTKSKEETTMSHRYSRKIGPITDLPGYGNGCGLVLRSDLCAPAAGSPVLLGRRRRRRCLGRLGRRRHILGRRRCDVLGVLCARYCCRRRCNLPRCLGRCLGLLWLRLLLGTARERLLRLGKAKKTRSAGCLYERRGRGRRQPAMDGRRRGYDVYRFLDHYHGEDEEDIESKMKCREDGPLGESGGDFGVSRERWEREKRHELAKQARFYISLPFPVTPPAQSQCGFVSQTHPFSVSLGPPCPCPASLLRLRSISKQHVKGGFSSLRTSLQQITYLLTLQAVTERIGCRRHKFDRRRAESKTAMKPHNGREPRLSRNDHDGNALRKSAVRACTSCLVA